MQKCDYERLLHIINVSSFAMDDTRLFLDTHPGDSDALMFFEKNKKIREAAIAKYNENYGAFCSYDGPMYPPYPWEGGKC